MFKQWWNINNRLTICFSSYIGVIVFSIWVFIKHPWKVLFVTAVRTPLQVLSKLPNFNCESLHEQRGWSSRLDLQVVKDSIQSALAFLGNAATQFSAYRRTKILEECNKDLMSFSEEISGQLPRCCLVDHLYTKQAADHLGQVEALMKVKGKAPPAKQVRWQGGASHTIEAMGRKGLQARAHPRSR